MNRPYPPERKKCLKSITTIHTTEKNITLNRQETTKPIKSKTHGVPKNVTQDDSVTSPDAQQPDHRPTPAKATCTLRQGVPH